MAEGKKSFKMYNDQRIFFDQLPDELAGKMIKHIFSYVSDEEPNEDNLMLKLAFSPIKRQLKYDLIKYNKIVNRNRLNGNLGGRPKTQTNPKNPVGYSGLNKNPDKPDKDKDKDKEDNNREKINVSGLVKLKKSEIDTLIKKHGVPNYKMMVEILHNYKLSQDKKYKSDYGAINLWVTKELKKRTELKKSH